MGHVQPQTTQTVFYNKAQNKYKTYIYHDKKQDSVWTTHRSILRLN